MSEPQNTAQRITDALLRYVDDKNSDKIIGELVAAVAELDARCAAQDGHIDRLIELAEKHTRALESLAAIAT